MKIRLLLLMIGLLIVSTTHAQRLDAPEYAQRGEYAVGSTDVVLRSDTRPLNVTIWYPAQLEEGQEESRIHRAFLTLTVEGNSAEDATPAPSEAPYPLVIYSHGSGGSRLVNLWIAEHLASWGFIVMAVDHAGNTLIDGLTGQNDTVATYAYRPEDLLRQIDEAEALNADSMFAGLIDTDNIAVVGHSLGGWTTLQLGGARLNFDKLREYCENPLEDVRENTCFLLESALEIAAARGYDMPPKGNWDATVDPRIQAIVTYAPYNIPSLDTNTVNVPAMVITGTADETTPPVRDTYPLVESLSVPNHLATLQLAGHNIFVDECPNTNFVTEDVYPSCSDEVWDMDRAHDLAKHLTTLFLLQHLKGDEEAEAFLLPENINFRGVDYTVSN